MSPAGTAERDVDVGFALRRVAREQHEHEVADPLERLGLRRVALDVLLHRRFEPGLRAQLGIPMWVVEEAHVKHDAPNRHN